MKRDREQGGLLGNIIWEGVLKCGEVEPDSARGGEGRGRIYSAKDLQFTWVGKMRKCYDKYHFLFYI